MTIYRASSDRKIGAAIAAAVLQVGLGFLLISGFTVPISHVIDRDLKLFGVTPPPPPPPPPPPKPKPKPRPTIHKAGAAAPPNIRSKATEVVAPPPKIPMPVPPPIVAAPIPAQGHQASSGAADKPGTGTGTGAGGSGDGTGSGGKGNGDGGGAREAYQKSGRIRGSDYPKSALRAHVGGTVYVSFTVEVDGHATGCVIRRTSGNPDIDATTCNLIEQRYRYEPARDANGRKIRSRIENQDHTWVVDHDSDDDDDRDRPDRDDR